MSCLSPETSGRRQPVESPANLLSIAHKSAPGRPFIRVTTPTGETLVRTSEAQLVTRPAAPAHDETDPTEWLTLKPEDAWDLLNVADQHHDLVETLRELGSRNSQGEGDHAITLDHVATFDHLVSLCNPDTSSSVWAIPLRSHTRSSRDAMFAIPRQAGLGYAAGGGESHAL